LFRGIVCYHLDAEHVKLKRRTSRAGGFVGSQQAAGVPADDCTREAVGGFYQQSEFWGIAASAQQAQGSSMAALDGWITHK